MPALTANTVTLEEVLEVRGGPLTEEELWAVLAQSCEALQDVFQRGNARNRFYGTYSITPEMILLCHTGRVKFSLDKGYQLDRSYTAPETYANRATPSDTALEKICVYSLGMSLYHAAEFEVAVGKPISLNESLESVLLGMCEESAHARSGLFQVMQECHSHYSRQNYRDIVALLVESLLGDEIPDIEVHDSSYDREASNSTDVSDYDISEEMYPSRFSPVLASPRSLPSPPSLQTSSRGQPTSAQLVGGNRRRVLTPPMTQRSASPRLNNSRPLPPTLEKYRSALENARTKRSMATSLNGLDQLHAQESSRSLHHSLPPQHPINRSEPRLNTPDAPSLHYQKIPEASSYYPRPPAGGRQYERPPSHLSSDAQNRSVPSGTRQDTQGLNRFASMHSVASDSSSSASGPRSSMFSDGRSSSAISITQGSYAPESYLTDGYESEFNLKSFGSSVSRNAFRAGRDIPSSSDHRYMSVNDLHEPSAGLGSPLGGPHPGDHRYRSLPNINKFNDIEKEKLDSKENLKTFFGPEFVMITEDPEKSIVNITPISQLRKDGQKKGFHLSHNRKIVTVVALNGQKLQLMAEISMTTKDLFEHVTRFLGITEKIFFGLAKIEDDEVIFLDLDVKLSKYAPPKWKESKGEMVEFILYLRVKFYVEHTELLSQATTRHQFYLQLRKDILEGRLYCHEEAAFILAGLALQAETGDYVDSLEGDYFLVEHYLNERTIKKLSVENTTIQLPEFHKNFAGLTEQQAEQEFIQEAQKLPEYGIHFYQVQYSKKSDSGEKLYIGICVRGVTIYESRGHIKSPIHKHSWPMTKKLSFKKKKFFIEPRSNPDGVKLTFYTNHYKKAKYLLQMCTAFHRFQMKMRTRLASIEHEMAVDLAIENQHQAVDGLPKAYDRKPAPPSYKQNSLDAPMPRSLSTEYRELSVDLPEERYHAMPRSLSAENGEEESDTDENYHLPRSVSMQYSIDENHNKDYHGNEEPIGKHGKHDDLSPYVIDSTLNAPSKQESQQDDTRDIPSPKSPDGEIPNSRDILSSPDREIRVIKFTKEPGKGLGITVLGGENSKRLDRGIYVKSVTEGGAAARDGRLKAGDRILAVNGNSLEQVTHERAVTLLKTISSTVELVVSQSPHNVSALDLSNIPAVGSANEEPQTLEVKPLITPPQQEFRHLSRSRVESPCSSDTLSPTETHPSTFNFPSEDEPVTMISKSISSLATPQSSYHSVPSKGRDSPSNYHSVSPLEKSGNIDSEEIPEPVTMATLESPNVSGGVSQGSKSPTSSHAKLKLSSRDVWQSDISNESQSSFTAGSVGSERSIEQGNSMDSDDLPDKSFTVELEKIDKSLGLSVTGGINTTVKLGGIYVKSLMLNGPADRDGQIRIGDRILAVDGISLVGVTHKQAVEIIRRAPQRCKIILDRSVHVNVPASIKKNSSRSQPTDKPFVVELVKGIGGLGLSLVGGRDAGPEHGGLLRIKKMFPGQPAALSKKLALGDIVLEVNEKSLENASHQDAINMIRHEPSVVRLLVKRDPSTIPEVLLSRAASNASDVDPVQLLNDIQNRLRSQTTSPVSSSSQETQPNNIDQKLAAHLEAVGEIRNLREKREESVAYDSDRTLQHQFSDPSALIAKQKDHEPVTTSHSLPGKLSLKSRYFDNKPDDEESVRKYNDDRTETKANESPYRKGSDSAVRESEQRRPDRRGSDKISSESDLPSLLQHIRSQDSLKRIISPQAPLAEYEESDLDIDEGIMINVDDGVAVRIDDDDDERSTDSDSHDDDDDIDTITKPDEQPYTVSSERKVSLDANDDDDSSDDAADDNEDDDDESRNKVVPTTMTPPKDTSDTSDIDDDDDDDNNVEDIDAVLELLSSGQTQQKSVELSLDQQNQFSDDNNSEIDLDINEDLHLEDHHLEPMPKNSNKPGIEETNNKPLYNQPGPTWSEESLSEKLEGFVETIVESTPDLTKIPADEEASLTPKEQLIKVELEKGSGGLGFTLAGGADTVGGCFVRDVIGDPAKADGRLQKGDQILQVDDTDIRNMKHMQAVNVLRATKNFVKLVVLRRPTVVVKDGNSGHLETVNLTRTSRGRIGLLLKEDDEGFILVDDVVPGEPASVEGNLKHGDIIVEIGGRKVEGVGFLAARQYLDAARPVVQLLVKRTNRAAVSKYSMGGSLEPSFSLSEDLPEENVDSSPENTDEEQDVEDTEEPKDDVFTVQLEKGTRGFGFSLVAAPSTEPNVQGIFIKTISAGSVAEKDGRLKIGDQLLKVNDEDVHGLSHARVIGMLRKVTTTVSLEIKRPGGAVTQSSSKEDQKKTKISGSQNSSPLSNSLDLDITLEDKEVDEETLTGSSEVKDEDEIIDLLNAISESNKELNAPSKNKQHKPTLHKRDTDSVLSSILSSIAAPPSPPSSTTPNNDVNDDDSIDSESDAESLPGREKYTIDDNRPGYSTGDSLQRLSSGSSESKHLSDGSTNKSNGKNQSLESSDSDYEDMNVFDMLQDNSEMEMNTEDISNINNSNRKLNGTISDVPPPVPTTPIPSGDEEDLPAPPPRKESLFKSYEDGWSSSGDSDYSSKRKQNGFVNLHSSSSEGEMASKVSGPLIDVTSGGKYAGHKLKMLIGALQSKIGSNVIADEFKALREIKPTDDCSVSKHPENKDKNRYRNVLPFNQTRVHLSGEGNEDYINASHIRVPVGEDTYHYIASQGPLPNTTKDFWQMIWEQSVEVIVMATLEREGGKVKCHRYWPESEDLVIPRKFRVTLLDMNSFDSFIERKFLLKHLGSGESIEVTHLNFTRWPDHGVPKCSVEMVQYVTYMRDLTSTQAPIVVHCSAGIGRTGALITVDVCLGLMQRDLMFDVDKIIRNLREQRHGMIQTKDQYIFCYKACLEVLRSLDR